ncbi:hypothetical protein [Azoarcus olearius]|uniref:Conserved hypothetical membrane protein n=1 Tax=Azoarcus sp. (strain BH72) TaxID=418699 RepID=A1K8S6_AZOSB|nr:hypothetical protein [Azoarcus olearius]ANQ85804.1 hypothetical protein dqs_2775 [Azoarcus olearius]CAL95231.1 conserved hypothetical membrane protein [Azoarcus olearius]
MSPSPLFARRVFTVAGVYGLIALLPQYFMEEQVGVDFPPAITHPEHFYGFLGVALAWQLAFLLIARDPQRYRLFMLPAAVEKFSFVIAAFALFAQARVPALVVAFACIDMLLGTLFLLSYRRTAAA